MYSSTDGLSQQQVSLAVFAHPILFIAHLFLHPKQIQIQIWPTQKSMPIKLNQTIIIECYKFNWRMLMVRRKYSAISGFVIENRKNKSDNKNNKQSMLRGY